MPNSALYDICGGGPRHRHAVLAVAVVKSGLCAGIKKISKVWKIETTKFCFKCFKVKKALGTKEHHCHFLSCSSQLKRQVEAKPCKADLSLVYCYQPSTTKLAEITLTFGLSKALQKIFLSKINIGEIIYQKQICSKKIWVTNNFI